MSFTRNELFYELKIVYEDKQNDEERVELKVPQTVDAAAADVIINAFDIVSQLAVRRVGYVTTAVNASFVQTTTGETEQPTQLAFANALGWEGSFSIPDVDNSCFVDTSGTGPNSKILKSLVDLNAASAGTPAKLLGSVIIAGILAGDIIFTIGTLPATEFLRGYREN